MKNILALDQSSNISGYAYFAGEELMKYDLLDTSKGGKAINRMILIIQWLEWFTKNNEVNLLVLEDVVLQNEAKYKQSQEYKDTHTDIEIRDNIATFQTLTKLLGIIECHCVVNNIEYTITKPSEWRSACGIQGVKRADVKHNAKEFVKNKWGLDVKEDVAESICIGWSQAKPVKTGGWGTFLNK